MMLTWSSWNPCWAPVSNIHIRQLLEESAGTGALIVQTNVCNEVLR